MKLSSFYIAFIAFVGLCLITSNVTATPITFDLADDIGGSSVGFTDYHEGIYGFFDGSTLEVALAAGLDDVAFTLNDGQESDPFDFLTFTATGTGIGFFGIEATMAFETPNVGPAVSSGGGGWGSVNTPGWAQQFFGLEASYQGGALNWVDNTISLTDTLGNSFTVTLDQGTTLVSNGTTSLQATIYNNGSGVASVPEPQTMLLFGTGLAGLAGLRLRRKK